MKLTFEALKNCNLCPRNCHTDRFAGANGYCKSDYRYNISSIVNHKGEEPLISGTNGLCNIFFSHCNLQCVYCQNHQISDNSAASGSRSWSFDEIISSIKKHLDSGCRAIGFVTPSHHIPHVVSIIKAFEHYNPKPIFVYNTNAYDKVEVLKQLEGLIDVYLPDLKYASGELSAVYSGAADYPSVSRLAVKEMFRQKGAALHLLDEHQAESGLIIRHLVLPGHIDNSIAILRFIAEELSPKIHVSLMSQYYPAHKADSLVPLNRTLTVKEYHTVLNEMEKLGLSNGWIQQLESHASYVPDFEKEHPFEG
jgi:putative pyruvate formate lyase activating enzyme